MAQTERDSRTRILDVAWELTRERGLAGLTLAEIAKAAGVSRQAVYLHYGTRAGLLIAMARHYDRSSGFVARTQATRSRPPKEAFEELIGAWLRYVPTILPVARALEAAATVGEEGGDAWHDRMSSWRDTLLFAVQRLADAGILADGWTVDRATDWVWAQVQPSSWHHLVVERKWPAAEYRRRMLDLLRGDLLTPARTPNRR